MNMNCKVGKSFRIVERPSEDDMCYGCMFYSKGEGCGNQEARKQGHEEICFRANDDDVIFVKDYVNE